MSRKIPLLRPPMLIKNFTLSLKLLKKFVYSLSQQKRPYSLVDNWFTWRQAEVFSGLILDSGDVRFMAKSL